MSILDHSAQYDIKELDQDASTIGKYFWFSGSMKRQKKRKQVKEDDVIEVPINIEESLPPPEDQEEEHGGTYFKLNGSLEESDLTDDEEMIESEENGGTWFSVSFREHRAQSMQNLLKMADPNQERNILPDISEKQAISIDMPDSVYNNGIVDDCISDENIITQELLENMPDSVYNNGIVDDCISDENIITQELLENFDAQFLEIEKLVMESFDDIDFSVTSPSSERKGKKNKRFGVDDIEKEPNINGKPKPFGNETRRQPFSSDTCSPTNKPDNQDHFSFSNDQQMNVNDIDEKEYQPTRPPKPINYMNGHVSSSKKEHSITVTSPDTGQKEYKLGETIHFRVSVREKKHPSSNDAHKEKSHKKIIKYEPEDTTNKPKLQSKNKKRESQNTPRTVAEKKYQFENHITNTPKQYKKETKKQRKEEKMKVDEEIVQEKYIKDDYAMGDIGENFIDSYLTENTTPNESDLSRDTVDYAIKPAQEVFSSNPSAEAPRMLLKRQGNQGSLSQGDDSRNTEDSRSEFDSSEDEGTQQLKRNRSFRRSIIIEDNEVSIRRRKSVGGTSVSVAFIAINKKSGEEEKVTVPQRLKGILNFLDNMVLDDESLGLYYDSVRQLHTVFWDLKDKRKSDPEGGETLSSALNFLVVQEWPKVVLGCFKKLKAAYPHVFIEEESPESTVYYSGHLPSLLRMNRTTSEFAVSVIFDGLLRASINFTDVHEASRQACCEDNLLSYLMDEIMSQLHNIKWGKATAREMFLKSISDLIYNCAQSYSTASYLLEHNCVNVLTQIRDETFHLVDARKVNMTLLLTLSYLIDDNNYDIIIPDEGSIIRVLQFLDKSLEHSEHTHHDFYAAELAGCLSRLAGHNTNKVLITRNSGQEILHKLLKYAYGDGERIAACHALWNLSFCREAKDILRGMGKLMNLLRDLAASSNTTLHHAAAGIIWECEEKYDIKGTREIHQASPGHVMLSFEHEAQPLVIGIRDELNRKGYQVWMSNDNDDRSLQDIMTKGVERASIVIVAVTRKYKMTPFAFAEVDYAHTLRKTIIPIIIDVDFVPDGWLKELIETEKTFDFSRRSMFAGSLDALADHVTSLCSPDARRNSLNAESLGSKRSSDVLSWSNADVIYWLKENQLIRSVSNAGRLNKLTGLHLMMFFDLKRESPDYYYSVLDSHLGFKDVLDTLQFTYAMDRLLGSERLI